MLVFIDESGYPRPTDSTKNPILLGVCIHENDIKPITNQIYKLKNSIYGKQDEIKSTKLIREATITKNRTNNKAYVDGMVEIISSYDAAVFAIIMDKPDTPVIVPEHHLPKQYYLLMKKVEFYCNHHHYGKAMMIFDEVHEDADRKIAEAMTGFLFRTDFGRSFNHVLEMPLFVSSAVTPAVQFADIFAGIVRHYYENKLDQKAPETDFQKWLTELFDKLYHLTENNRIPKSPYVEYGFQKIGKNFSYPVSEKYASTDDATSLSDVVNDVPADAAITMTSEEIAIDPSYEVTADVSPETATDTSPTAVAESVADTSVEKISDNSGEKPLAKETSILSTEKSSESVNGTLPFIKNIVDNLTEEISKKISE